MNVEVKLIAIKQIETCCTVFVITLTRSFLVTQPFSSESYQQVPKNLVTGTVQLPPVIRVMPGVSNLLARITMNTYTAHGKP